MSNNEIPVKEIGELLEMVSAKVPNLLKEIMATFYSEEAANNMGAAVGTFYKKLLDSGINQEDAMKMTHDYMNTLKNLIPQDFAKFEGNFHSKEKK
ncbi:MAG: hypothetical protein GX085_04590 [Firmicutes bacterium]|nr:hypothetical protein [Bacillota bacterium]